MSLTKEELARYNRHIILPELGLEGQQKLKNAAVLVIGSGGLGSPVLQYLNAAGVGKIGIVEDDVVDRSNLQRQILFPENSIGRSKADVAEEFLQARNSFTKTKTYYTRLSKRNALEIIKDYDLVVDGTDNFATRYLINDACVILKKPFVYGSIFKFEGQISVFNYQGGPTYRCLFPEPPEAGSVPSCSQIGVIGVLPGVIGTMQANEAIKVITGIGEPLSGKLYSINLLDMKSQTFGFFAEPENLEITELMDSYEDFCGTNQALEMKSLSVDEALEKITSEEWNIIDVREPFEYEIAALNNSILIPLNQIPGAVNKIDRNKPTVVYCHHGMRSAQAIQFLQDEYGYNNLYNLEGGIDQWSLEIDNSVERY